MKKILGLAFLAVAALSLSSCCCDRDPCCDCPPRPRCCEAKPCCPTPPCCPTGGPRYYDNNNCY